MTELIEVRREQAIREYECMKHLKLFTDAEIRAIKTKRHHHDYKVERRSKNLADFINYITYECNLFYLLLERRRKLRIRAEWVSLEKSIHNRVRVLYRRALTRFASEYRVWTHFLDYCDKRRFFTEGSKVLDQMLGFHGDKPKAWLCAINWEHRQGQNMARAKHYTLRGLQRHPECRELCITFIRMQLGEADTIIEKSGKTAEKLNEIKNEELEKVLKTIRVVYKNFERKDVEFYGQLMEELQQHNALKHVFEKEIIADMRQILADKEEMWNMLANRALEGVDLKENAKQVTFAQRLSNCVEIYQEAIERLPTKKMHSFCIDTMLQINASTTETGDEKAKRKALANAFKNALLVDQLEEEKLLQYIKLLLHNKNPKEELVMAAINKGIEQYPASADIWSVYFRYLIQKEVDVKELEDTFSKAIKSVRDGIGMLTLWKMLFHYYNTRPNQPGMMDELFRSAIDQVPEVSHHYQPLFLEHLHSNVGQQIAKIRHEYNRLVKNFSTPLELHQKMASIEAAQTRQDVNEWRKCYENATHFHGEDNPTVWLQYVQFERDHGKPQHIQSLYERAKAVLDEDAFATFFSEYEMIRNPYIVRY